MKHHLAKHKALKKRSNWRVFGRTNLNSGMPYIEAQNDKTGQSANPIQYGAKFGHKVAYDFPPPKYVHKKVQKFAKKHGKGMDEQKSKLGY